MENADVPNSKFPPFRGPPPEPVPDSKGLGKPMIPVRFWFKPGLKNSPAKMKQTPRCPRLPFGSRAATSAAANFHKSNGFRDRDGASVRLFHAGLVQDLSRQPQGPR